MSVRAVSWALEQPDLTPPERFVLVVLAEAANTDGSCFPSHHTVARRTGYSRRYVQQIIRSLVRHRKVDVIERTTGPGRQTSNLYLLRYGMNQRLAACGESSAQAVDNPQGGVNQGSSPSQTTGPENNDLQDGISPLESSEPRSSNNSTESLPTGGAVDNKKAPASMPASTQSAPCGAQEVRRGSKEAALTAMEQARRILGTRT